MSGPRIVNALVSGAILFLVLVLPAGKRQAAGPASHDLGAHDPAIRQSMLTVRRIQVAQSSEQTCGLVLDVSGGTFSPDFCQFEIISGGPPCQEPDPCRPDYAVNLRNTTPAHDEIMSVVLFNFTKFETGTYMFDPGEGLEEFKGQLIDSGAIARHLLRGSITLNVQRDNEVGITLDVQFANGIAVQGSGVIDVKRVNAP